MLKSDGYEVTVGAQPGRGRGDRSSRDEPDLAIVDLMMEEQDSGFVLCHEFKKLYPELPVIILTAVKAATGMSFAPVTDGGAVLGEGRSVLDKPVRPEQLKQEVERLLKVKPAETGAHKE